jgi:hypothetical protein
MQHKKELLEIAKTIKFLDEEKLKKLKESD